MKTKLSFTLVFVMAILAVIMTSCGNDKPQPTTPDPCAGAQQKIDSLQTEYNNMLFCYQKDSASKAKEDSIIEAIQDNLDELNLSKLGIASLDGHRIYRASLPLQDEGDINGEWQSAACKIFPVAYDRLKDFFNSKVGSAACRTAFFIADNLGIVSTIQQQLNLSTINPRILSFLNGKTDTAGYQPAFDKLCEGYFRAHTAKGFTEDFLNGETGGTYDVFVRAMWKIDSVSFQKKYFGGYYSSVDSYYRNYRTVRVLSPEARKVLADIIIRYNELVAKPVDETN